MPIVASGFGDGSFPVYILNSPEGCVGVEIVFIPADAPYPF